MTRIRLALASCACWAVAFAGCSGNGGAMPSSPSPSAVVTAIAVTSPVASGPTVQLAASARLSDGSTRDVTAVSSWASSDASIATVSATGLATIIGTGTVEFRATYQHVLGTLSMHVAPGFTLAGTAREVGPGSPPVAGVRVAIVGGVGAGASATSDAAGVFRFSNVSGLVSLEATKIGYLTWRLSNLTVDHDTNLDAALYPTPPLDASGATATARCVDGTWSWAQTVAQACAANGGILYGVCPGALCAATRSIPVR